MYAFLPFKGLQGAKSRWPPLGAKRERLVLELLRHNLQIVSSVIPLRNTFLVTPDSALTEQFSHYGHYLTGGLGLNQDLHHAREQLMSLRAKGSLLVLLPDLPTLCLEDVESLLQKSQEHSVVVCPDEEGLGTNALALNPWDGLDFVFEGHSCPRFLQAADLAGLDAFELRRPGLARDCDNLEDLERYSLL